MSVLDALLRRTPRADAPVWAVAGHMRSGTTMMMRALEAGGMRVDRAPVGEDAAPNGDTPRDDYELSRAQLRQGWDEWGAGELHLGDTLPAGRFPNAHRGRLIKIPCGAARYCDPVPGGYRVVFIHRNPVDILRSEYDRWGYSTHSVELIEQAVARELAVWRNRDDCEVQLVEVRYEEVLRSPFAAFVQLRTNGWPIDPRKAARIVDPQRPLRRMEAARAG